MRMAVEGWEFQGLGIDGSELGFRVQDLGWRGWGGGWVSILLKISTRRPPQPPIVHAPDYCMSYTVHVPDY